MPAKKRKGLIAPATAPIPALIDRIEELLTQAESIANRVSIRLDEADVPESRCECCGATDGNKEEVAHTIEDLQHLSSVMEDELNSFPNEELSDFKQSFSTLSKEQQEAL